LKLTCASKLLNIMMQNGTFTHIFHPHNEKMFDNASIDVIVFRYCKNQGLEKQVLYNNELRYIINSNGMITMSETENTSCLMFKDYFDIYVGLVSGKENVYKNNELGTLNVLNNQDKFDKYIYEETFPCDNEHINTYLLQHKDVLMKRHIRKFNETNWFEWGAPRNMTAIRANMGAECIYVNTLTRKANVAFTGVVNYFGGGLIMLKPKQNNGLSLHCVVSYMNSTAFKDNFTFSKRFKIGHRQISNSYIQI
jgi:adenine-specific DNA-methyltransferase